MVAARTLILSMLTLTSCSALPMRAPIPCELAPIYVLEGASHIHESWPRLALAAAYRRVGPRLACQAMQGAEVWVYLHDGVPIGCAGVGAYDSCTFGVGAGVHQVEVDMRAVRSGAAASTYEVIHHEMVHVLLTRLGVPGREHHQMMGRWLIDTESRRRHEYE